MRLLNDKTVLKQVRAFTILIGDTTTRKMTDDSRQYVNEQCILYFALSHSSVGSQREWLITAAHTHWGVVNDERLVTSEPLGGW